MKRIDQKVIARYLGISPSFLSEVFSGDKRFGPQTALRIGSLLDIGPMVLLYGKPSEIKAVIQKKSKQQLTG